MVGSDASATPTERSRGLAAATLAGPLRTSLDRLGDGELPDVTPGDLQLFGQAGAYGLPEAMTNFLLHPVPSEIWVER